MEQVDTRHSLEQFAVKMGYAAGATGRHIDPARISFCIGDEFGQRLGWKGRIHYHDTRTVAIDARDRGDVGDKIETEVVIKGCVDRVYRTHHKKRVSIGRRFDY